MPYPSPIPAPEHVQAHPPTAVGTAQAHAHRMHHQQNSSDDMVHRPATAHTPSAAGLLDTPPSSHGGRPSTAPAPEGVSASSDGTEKGRKAKATSGATVVAPKPLYLKAVQSKLKQQLDRDRQMYIRKQQERKEIIAGTSIMTCEEGVSLRVVVLSMHFV
jgi:hypothetical protein